MKSSSSSTTTTSTINTGNTTIVWTDIFPRYIHHNSYPVHIGNPISDSFRHSLDGRTKHHHLQLGHQPALRQQSFVPFRPPTPPDHSQRSLTNAFITLATCDEMNAIANEAPGSPPGLSNKSSKSSTNRSSSISGSDAILSDITHFEEIGLHDEGDQRFQPGHMNGIDIPKRPVPHSAAININSHRSNRVAVPPIRDLTNRPVRAQYPRSPEFYNAPNGAAHSLNLPHVRPMRKGFRNASTPSLAITAMSNCNRSRSPSPKSAASPVQKPLPNPISPRRPPLSPAKTVQQIPLRRGSWQPSRKSIKELEAECDDDEDLPDEAILSNVPLSPRPPSERALSMSAVPPSPMSALPPSSALPLSPMSAMPPSPVTTNHTLSPKLSPGASPERSSPLRTSIGSDGIVVSAPKTAPMPSARRTLPANFPTPPHSPHRLIRGASTGNMADHPNFSRSKSWNIALSELSEEAQALTETLENHAIEAETVLQTGTEPAMETLTRSKTASAVGLPPLRMNNIMIDPLPVSKEKEKVLSRTRPSWLPPKSKSEEKRHLKEYQRMMEFSLDAERRKAAKIADIQCAKDESKSALHRIWEEHVLPNWDQVIREPRTRELWWRGVAPKSRALVWQKAIGNDLGLTDTTFKKALQRAETIAAAIQSGKGDQYGKEKAWFDAIQRDVKVALPDLKIFQPGGPLHDDLVQVLKAFSMYRSDVGYSHGTHLVAAFLSLTMPTPSQTFICLANLMNRPLPLAFLTGDPSGTQKAYDLTLSVLSKKYPRLHNHLFRSPSATANGSANGDTATLDVASLPLNLPPSQVLEPMMRTLFLGPSNGLGIDIASRVWDVMVFDGDAAIIRTTVAILGALEGKLYGGRNEVLDVLGWRGSLGAVGTEDAFMSKVRAVGKAM